MKALVTGCGGFVGGHLAQHLVENGYEVIGADIKRSDDWSYFVKPNISYATLDLRSAENAARLIYTHKPELVFNLAAGTGAADMESVLINTNLLRACRENHIPDRYFFSSSAGVYAADKQTETEAVALKEEDAYPAMPEDGYGWEKLFSERMCRHFNEGYNIPTRVARYHDVYGPWGVYDESRENAPAALCRKVIQAVENNSYEIEIWGDGEQTKSFMYIDDCIEGTMKITNGGSSEPVNLGSSQLVSINQLVTIVEEIANTNLKRSYKLDAPVGVRGRNSDNAMIKEIYDWEPSISLRKGLERTYAWIRDQMKG